MYKCEALQMSKNDKQKVFQLACKQARYGFTENSPYTSYRVYYLYCQISYCTFPIKQSDLYMLVTKRLLL